MCVGVPMRVVSLEGAVALCEGRGRRESIDVALVGQLAVGAFVLAHQGRAVRAMTPDEAAQTNAALDALDAALAGERSLDAFFPDLAGREPQLPPHLRRSGS
jgi:hydrogenase assembly chaperone HypC/HupF